ncbi:MAG TPA: M2 family metallopeptidase [Polyangiaceae bacterium]|jgi:peptidyl-dipeptidase A|nr:M2 family metallopeptidase [Polyangiaceae bacterium]
MRGALTALALLAATACSAPLNGGASGAAPTTGSAPAAPRTSATPSASTPPTVAEALAFLERVDRELRKLWIRRDRAAWVSENFITDDTEAIAADAESATSAYVIGAVREAARFKNLDLPEDARRKLMLLRLAQTVPAPDDAALRDELSGLETKMVSAYGKASFCSPRKGATKSCENLDDLSKIIGESRDYDTLLEAWVGWHGTARPLKDDFARYVELGNRGARDIGFGDLGEVWRSGYDMTPAEFDAELDRLWNDVRPFYERLHCFVRSRLQKRYGKERVKDGAPIPAHLLGNMWAQEWTHLYDLVEPVKGQSTSIAAKLKAYDAKGMVKLGERFFVSLGLEPLPPTFWERSLFTRPKDRDVVCHASAWDISYSDDLRIKMCITPTEEDLVTIHHELGHDYYSREYSNLPMLFQAGANDGFHEGIGDTLALSVTPAYLKELGLLDAVPKGDGALLDQLMKTALDKVAFLPFGLLVDRWRWQVFSGKIPKERYNAAWWELRERYQGVSAPVARTENDFDPGAKYHVPSSTPYARYFLAHLYQFQFHAALCKAAGYVGPLAACSIYGSKEAGARLRTMLALGASRPWPDALEALGAGRRIDAHALLEYFAPLTAWLDTQLAGQTCGWK